MESLQGARGGRTSLLSTVGAWRWGAVQLGTRRADRSAELLEHIQLKECCLLLVMVLKASRLW